MTTYYRLNESYKTELLKIRRHFHQYPELSLEEKYTSDYIENYLQSIGLTSIRIGKYGLVTTVYADNKNCKTVAIRAEMDAIAVEEKNDFEWKSKNKGIMHACGHDAILASALMLAKICVENVNLLPVNVKFIFQPAEENGKGTDIMLDGGVMHSPDVDYFVMFHYVNDAPAGMELQRGSSSAMIGSIELKICGKSSHWCTKELGIDSIEVAGKILGVIEKINKTYQGKAPFVIGIGKISGGSAKNVIAEETILEGTIRACDKNDYYQLQKIFVEQLCKIQEEYGIVIEAQVGENPVPSIINDDALVDMGIIVGKKVWGSECRMATKQYLSGDSASYYFDYAKGIYFIFTAEKTGEVNFPLHNGRFDLDEQVMTKAVEFLFCYIMEMGR